MPHVKAQRAIRQYPKSGPELIRLEKVYNGLSRSAGSGRCFEEVSECTKRRVFDGIGFRILAVNYLYIFSLLFSLLLVHGRSGPVPKRDKGLKNCNIPKLRSILPRFQRGILGIAAYVHYPKPDWKVRTVPFKFQLPKHSCLLR